MQLSEFKSTLDALRSTNSRNEKKDIVKSVSHSPAAVSFLSGSEYDDAGLGKKTVHSVAEEVFGSFDPSPTLSEAVEDFDSGNESIRQELEVVRDEMRTVAELSGNEQKEHLKKMFEWFEEPAVVAHACLNDWPTGCSDKTIADATDTRESLPFVGSVVEAVEMEDPPTSPEVGRAFDPQLAAPESRGRPDGEVRAQMKLDGARCIIHVGAERVTAFSRRKNDITESLPELGEISWPDGEYIIDAEVLAETGSYSDTSERIGRTADNVEREVEMCFGAFDLIRAENDVKLHEKPYRERYDALRELETVISDSRFHVLGLEKDIEKSKDMAADNGEEGIIVKSMDSPYEFGKRSSHWQKVKMDDETVDVRICGFEEGEGRLDGTLGKVEIESVDGVHVGYTGSGFTDVQRDEIWNNKDEWRGDTIEVEARGLGTHGNLRMPIYERDRRGDGTADSFSRVKELMKDV